MCDVVLNVDVGIIMGKWCVCVWEIILMNIIWSVVFIVDCVWGVFDIVNLNGIMVWLYWID